jgi:hypothetical protein
MCRLSPVAIRLLWRRYLYSLTHALPELKCRRTFHSSASNRLTRAENIARNFMRRLMGYLIVVRPKYSHRQREIVNVMCGSNSLERVVSVSSAVRLVVLCRVGRDVNNQANQAELALYSRWLARIG